MSDDEQTIFDTAKTLLQIDSEDYDAIIEIYACEVYASVLAYCRLEVMPRQLLGLCGMITADVYRRIGAGAAAGVVSRIEEGERAVSYSTDSGESFLTNWEDRLKPFVNRRGFVPSDFSN